MGNILSISVSCDKFFSDCQDCFVGRSAYVHELKDNLVALQSAAERLAEVKSDVLMKVMVAEQQKMKRLNQVQGWLSRVGDVEIEVADLIRDSSHQIEKLCLGGYCSRNLKSSYKFGKKVAQKLEVVSTLKNEGVFPSVAERVLLPEEDTIYEPITGERILPEIVVDERPCEPTVGLESTFDMVWRCIGDKELGVIGLYGMGGVGKTTLLTQINNKFLDARNDFDIVIWVVVSKDLQLEKIQENIGKKIGLSDESWKSKSLEEKAQDIFKILRKKKFVLLLDDIWERVDLVKVGVPHLNPNIKSKVVFTTRFIEVCGHMEAHSKLKVECLPDEEAWKLFQKKVGADALDSHPDIPELAKIAAKECGGLPLALITIGRAMACKKTPGEWKYAIKVLSRSAFEFPGMGKEVYPLLKFSYDSLPSETVRSCLLYCSLFPEDYSIPKKHLIDCWIGEGFLNDDDGDGTQNQGHHLIGVLLHACLLEEEDDDFVKMHDVIRDMTLWIACEIEKEKENYLVHAGAGLTEAPEIFKWIGIRRISLMENQINSLSISGIATFPHLLTLFLNRNDLSSITSGFWEYMSSLRVLNLSTNDSLRELPAEISKLVSLQYLDISETAIKELPKEFKALVNIKCLNLENTYYLHTVPRRLISNFPMLNVLRMFNCGFLCQGKESVLFGGSEYLVDELLVLKHLNALSITLKSSQAFEKFLSSYKLQSATQSLCLQYFDNSTSLNVSSLAGMKSLDALSIWNCKHLEELKIGSAGEVEKILEIHAFHNLVSVHIDCCLKLRDLTWLIFAPNVKKIVISSCYEMEEIISAGKLGEVPEMVRNQKPFARLQFLKLHHLHNLKSIYWSALAFQHLKEMVVYECPMLKKLPLDSNSAKDRRIVVEGEKGWWKNLQWEDQATQNAFHLSFRSS
ncbi:hypothetical protein LWI29_002497 [Acer saccharum]|uniref:AAA+ ATPase domain-containing protein n=1 Tax=Acer saccharum TaxID=4024 RepID=A0AA39STI3_ACESA|nr:hypothetical protein LWI29_002497 [Acer saccharum]